ncbi:ABC transporter substrate-binding protein [Acetobacter sp.]|uniref:ABC transporter substrate-binding protein n=1 Tax=Acetobacter sp. TaxID=440 RepID=UPI0039EBEACA
MKKSFLAWLALLAASSSSVALAAGPVERPMGGGFGSGRAEMVSKTRITTTFEATSDKSLTALLDEGYAITSATGDDGQVLYLGKEGHDGEHSHWYRCELIGDSNGNVRLGLSHHAASDCRALNK